MDFDQAIDIIIGLEGGLVDNPKDSGGVTKYGISLAAYPNLGRDGIINLTEDQAKKIYYDDYWMKLSIYEFPESLRLCLLDSAINQGVSGAIKCLQRALRVNDDGIIGPHTITAAKAISADELVVHFMNERLFEYISDRGWQEFGRGWAARLFKITLKAG